ncbi:TPA: hypothetical protein ACN023_003674, partial [Shigella boydii]
INEEKPYSSPLPPPYLYYSLMYVRKLRRKIIKKKADFCMLFCFCEAFSRNNKSVAVVSFITQKWFSYRPG